MKKILLFLIALGLFACSGGLSNSKAESIVKKALSEKADYGIVDIETGEFISKNFEEKLLALYKELESKGYMKIEKIHKNIGIPYSRTISPIVTEEFYRISLTDKSKEYLLETEEKSNIYRKNDFINVNKMKAYDIELEKVSNVHLDNLGNTAQGEVTLVKKNKTPFDILNENKADYFSSVVIFIKTTDNGWVLMR